MNDSRWLGRDSMVAVFGEATRLEDEEFFREQFR